MTPEAIKEHMRSSPDIYSVPARKYFKVDPQD
jgi:hypothetical protein